MIAIGGNLHDIADRNCCVFSTKPPLNNQLTHATLYLYGQHTDLPATHMMEHDNGAYSPGR